MASIQQETRKMKVKFWQPHIHRWRSSELKTKTYCQQHSLNHDQFKYWQYQLAPDTKNAAKEKTQSAKLFTEVKSSVSAAILPHSSSSFELLMPKGYCLKIPLQFDSSALSQLVQVMDKALC